MLVYRYFDEVGICLKVDSALAKIELVNWV